jgi:hypothetical protein
MCVFVMRFSYFITFIVPDLQLLQIQNSPLLSIRAVHVIVKNYISIFGDGSL